MVLCGFQVLGLLGHSFPIPQTGFQLAEEALDLTDAIVIIVSHSGGTFAPLAISKLLQAVTLNIYVVTSEWDTQVARELRSLASWSARSRIFSTGIGLRPAEPCSISVAATHQLLTQILLQLMQIVQASPALTEQAHCIPDDTRQLEALNQENIASLEAIVGVSRTGEVKLPPLLQRPPPFPPLPLQHADPGRDEPPACRNLALGFICVAVLPPAPLPKEKNAF